MEKIVAMFNNLSIDELMHEIVFRFAGLSQNVIDAAVLRPPSASLNGSDPQRETLWHEFVYQQQGLLPVSADCQEAIRAICQQVIANENFDPHNMFLYWLDTKPFERWVHDGGDEVCFSLTAWQQDIVDELFLKASEIAGDFDEKDWRELGHVGPQAGA
jgi:hypothetical protein